jgi:Listeria/Bacterioides repeat
MRTKRFISTAMALLLSFTIMPTIPSIAATTTPTTTPTAPEGYSLSYVGRYTQVTPISDDMIAVMVGIKDQGKWGFVNATTGEEIVAPKYIGVACSDDSFNEPGTTLRFFDGMARIYTNKGYTVINKKGKEIVPIGKYSDISNFYNGLAWVWVNDVGWGIIDKTGKEIVKPGKYQIMGGRLWETFDEGLIPVSKVDKKLGDPHKNYIVDGYIDVTGKEVTSIPFGKYYTGRFSDGLACVYDIKQKKNVFINKNGKIAFNLKSNSYGEFSDGLCILYPEDEKTEKGYTTIINLIGKEVLKLPSKYYAMYGYKDGYLIARSGPNEFNEDGKTKCKYNILDKNGKVIVSTKKPGEYLVDASNGLVAYYLDTELQQRIHGFLYFGTKNYEVYNLSTRKSIIPDGYTVVLSGKNSYDNDNFYQGGVFPDGMVKVYIPGDAAGTYDAIGFLDKNGKEVVPLGKYYNVEFFSENKCVVQSKETLQRGYVDTKGNEIIAPQFDQATCFINGKAVVGMYSGENVNGDEDAPLFDWYVLSVNPNPVTDKYTVKFNTLGGPTVSSITNVKTGLIIKPDTPVRKGYGFIGWYKNKNCTQSWDFTKDKIKANTTMYAKWKKI